MQGHFSTSQIIKYSLISGIVAGVLFIAFQSLFAMGTITGRHAQTYMELGAYSILQASVMAWLVHLLVSIAYASVSTIIFAINPSIWVSIAQTVALGWVTTLLATPANVFVMKLLGTLSVPALSSLPPVNTSVDAKLVLHIAFFVLVIAILYVFYKRSNNPNAS
jgi:magnesium-transporting ATPase (P-type)